MKKILVIIIASLLLIFIVIQFFPPKKNDNLINPQNDIVFKLEIPTAVKKKIVEACYDCHSDKTVYPIYNRIAPVSWMMAKDIRDAKAKLNYSEWASYDRKTQIKLLSKICDELKAGEMPLKRYVIMHSKAVINPDELNAICNWTEKASEQVMNQKE
jgi:hypothetical protein